MVIIKPCKHKGYVTNSIIRVRKTYMGVASRNFWIYLYISMRLPWWAIHASRSGAGASSNFLALARLVKNGNNAFPKCFVDCTQQNTTSALLMPFKSVLTSHLQKHMQRDKVKEREATPPLEVLLGGSRRPWLVYHHLPCRLEYCHPREYTWKMKKCG